MRSLVLINGKGDRYDLLSAEASPTFQLDGLGYSDSTEFARVGKKYIPLEDKMEQGQLSFTLLFWNSSDNSYKEFVKIARRNPLTILYENDAGMFYIPCRFRSIEKIDKLGYDKYGCPVSFALTGNPYKIMLAYNKGETGVGKNYGTFGYTYDYTYSNDILNAVIISSDSLVESSCVLTLYGELINPVWRHYVDGVYYESGAYNGTIPEGHTLVIDSKTVPHSITEYDSAGNLVADRYSLCDFSTERFMNVNEGENRYSISHDGSSSVKMKVEAYIEYEAV